MMYLINCSILLLCLIEGISTYKIPKVNFKVYRKGFQVSIPYKRGIESFIFTGAKVAGEQSNKVVTFSGAARKPDRNKYLVYKNSDAKLELGDIIKYCVFVKKNGRSYSKANAAYTVTKYTYNIVDPFFKVYRKGFEVSIPHEDGLQFLFFTSNITTEIHNDEYSNYFDGAAFKPDETGHWTYKNVDIELRAGMIIKYWIGVVKDGEGYFENSFVYTVKSNEESEAYATVQIPQYGIPDPSFKIYRKGFEVFIPYEDGIEMFIFTANLNSEIQKNDYGTIFGMIKEPDERGYLKYKNSYTELKLGDTINYWIGVKKNGQNYNKPRGFYTVRSYEETAAYDFAKISHNGMPGWSFKEADYKITPFYTANSYQEPLASNLAESSQYGMPGWSIKDADYKITPFYTAKQYQESLAYDFAETSQYGMPGPSFEENKPVYNGRSYQETATSDLAATSQYGISGPSFADEDYKITPLYTAKQYQESLAYGFVETSQYGMPDWSVEGEYLTNKPVLIAKSYQEPSTSDPGATFQYGISGASIEEEHYKTAPLYTDKSYQGPLAYDHVKTSGLLATSQYIIPEPSIKVYSRGFQLCIPHQDGIQLFGFTAIIKSQTQNNEYGTYLDGAAFNRDENGHWTHKNMDQRFELGDILHYAVGVRKNGKNYCKSGLIYRVTNYEEPVPYSLDETSQYKIPVPTFKVYNQGFAVSIPHEDAIQGFVFSCNINSEILNYEYGTFFGGACEPDETGHLTCKISNAKLKVGDVINYYVAITINREDHYKRNLVYTVKNYEETVTPATGN